MLAYIYSLMRDFEQEHGMLPNLLYLNRFHGERLKHALDGQFSMSDIREVLQMELVIDHDIVHPHVAWTHVAQRAVG